MPAYGRRRSEPGWLRAAQEAQRLAGAAAEKRARERRCTKCGLLVARLTRGGDGILKLEATSDWGSHASEYRCKQHAGEA